MNCPFSTARRRGRPARNDAVMAREDILRQAFLAFARLGYDGVSQRQLASECGVSDSLLHHHFGSKQQLWQEAADSVFAPLVAQLLERLEALARQGTAATTLRQNLPQALSFMMADPAALQFLFREGEGDSERSEYLRVTYAPVSVSARRALRPRGGRRAVASADAGHAPCVGHGVHAHAGHSGRVAGRGGRPSGQSRGAVRLY